MDPSVDRWGRVPALVFATTGVDARATAPPVEPPSLSVALAMVDAGLARARPDAETHACWPALLAAERAARTAGLGLWSDPAYAVRVAADEASVASAVGGLALIEGRVTRVGHGQARLYVGFGERGSDVELHLAKHAWPVLGELGLDAAHLSGRWLRARGFLDDRFGAAIDITSADQIELLPDGEAAAGGSAPAASPP